MSYLRVLLLVTLFCCSSAVADVWMWVDDAGESHFVETNRPLFTWVDKNGKTFYSDKPDHEDAVLVQMIWISDGTIEDLNATEDGSDEFQGESEVDRVAREEEEAHFCKRATEIYDSYVNAPRLYRTNEDGEREYLSKKEAEMTMMETKVKMNDLCK